MSATEPHLPNRRRWLGSLVAALSLAGLGACSKWGKRPPAVPYGQALDVTQAGTFVEFDFRIDKPDRYDVLLEVFEKVPKEKGPLPDVSAAHFKVRLQSLATPEGVVLVEREVSKAEGGLVRPGSVGPSIRRSRTIFDDIVPRLMSFKVYLSERNLLSEGTYRIRVDSLNPIPALQDRLVKVSVRRIYHPK